jgi:hypothetical protein
MRGVRVKVTMMKTVEKTSRKIKRWKMMALTKTIQRLNKLGINSNHSELLARRNNNPVLLREC